MNIWDEFEKQGIKARFAGTMDNIQIVLLNALNNGDSWLDRDISLILKRNENTAGGLKNL